MSFAELLRRLRQSRGLTQAEFATRAGVGVRTVRDLERGRARPQRATIELMARALDLTGPSRTEFTTAARGGSANAASTSLIPEQRSGREGVPQLFPLPPAPDLFGRARDLAELETLLSTAGLVTLVGVAGVGKTGLAWAAAHRLAPRFPGGTAGISISDVSTEADILAMVATVFGVPRARDLAGHIAGRPALLLVDGVERGPEPTRAALRWLRMRTPTLRVIATGRHPLGLPGEYVWPVAPLDVPPPQYDDVNRAAHYPAAALLLNRVRQVRGGAGLTPAESAVVGSLARRLGGLPLALELAAARGRVLALDEILQRYGDRVLDLSTTEDAPSSLREAVAASYRLLSPQERYALRRLAMFRHRFSLELAEPMLGDGGGDAIAVLDRLVSLGLVGVRGGGSRRFRLLDVVRDFAVERAEATGELAAFRARHARVMADYVARVAPELTGGAQSTAIAQLDDVASDLRGALTFAAEQDPITALRLAASLPRWWRFRGRDRAGRQMLERLLADPRTATADPATRAWAQLGVAQLANEHGEGVSTLPLAEEALAAFDRLGDVSGQIAARTMLCVLLQIIGGYDAARRHGEAVLALAQRHGRLRDTIVAQSNLAWHDIRTADLPNARTRLVSVQRLAADAGDERLRALAHANLAEVARLDGRYADAVATGRRALAMLDELGDPSHRPRVLGTVGLALAQADRADEATAVLDQLRGAGGSPGYAALIEAYLAERRGEGARAADRFSAAAEALAGQHDVRDVVESLVGLVATASPERAARARGELSAVCRRGGVTLLPVERERLAGAGLS
jgi:predicted ATPase/DNA-binding XRE family transcriptional regulator